MPWLAIRLADLVCWHHMTAMKAASAFVLPSLPVLKSHPPTGDEWIHEVKFDGWRVQIHKVGDYVTIFSRNGNDFTARFPYMRDSLIALPCRSAVIDAELVACGTDGQPRLLRSNDAQIRWPVRIVLRHSTTMGLIGRNNPLRERREILRSLLIKADGDALRFSDDFPNPEKLLAVAEKMGLEGVVSKLADQPYCSVRNTGWIKVKSHAWREANKDRRELFDSESRTHTRGRST
jgi:bifunctional non-homologous end joining protein LigD